MNAHPTSTAGVTAATLGAALALLAGARAGPGAEAGDGWWSLRPLAKPDLPAGEAANPVDRFVAATLREHALEPAPEADRRTLIRRLSFDLCGLPPSPEEVQRFVSDPDRKAYAKLVDRLLASPRYGERWARHWLDVVHYGETHGYDKDKPRPNAWPYRDYVVRAFNGDKPYARFVREQLAGDVLYPGTADGVVATGFIAAGPWDFIGHAEVPESKVDGKVARHLDRDDMVAATMNSFCSITVQCAQCHDHKADPVTMRDYYSLQAVFAALDRADRDYDPDPAVAARRADLAAAARALEGELGAAEAQIAAVQTDALRALDAEVTALEAALAASDAPAGEGRSPRYGYHSQVASSRGTVKWVQVDLGRSVPLDTVALFAADEYGFADFGFPHRFRVEASDDPEFGQGEILADHTGADFPRPGAAPVAVDGRGVAARYVRVTATELWSRRRKGGELTDDWIFALGELAVISGGAPVAVQGVAALDSIEAPPRWARADLIDGIYGAQPLAARAPEGILALLQRDAGAGREALAAKRAERDAALRALAPEAVATRDRLGAALAAKRAELAALPAPAKVYAGTVHHGSGTFIGRGHVGGAPREIFVLNRGQVTDPGEPAPPATVPGVVPGHDGGFALPEGHAEGERRAALAEWIVHPDNALTWRSIVNRVWAYHFGRGIVETPNDFGRIGAEPTHPELLDWLACEFRDGGGSIKELHRLIANSDTYKRAATAGGADAANAAIDAGNRYLWRANRRKLEAEAVRDTVLLAAGKLDLTMGGPSFQDFVIERPEHSPHYQYHKADPDDPTTHRRSIYRFIVRSQPQPFMDTLDCADPSQLVDRRGETTTALQALALLNNAFTVRMAEHFAERVKAEPEPVAAALRIALSREPEAEELAALRGYAAEHGLPATCRLIFNLNEFSYVD